MDKKLKEALIEFLMEMDGAGIAIADQDLVEDELEKISFYLEETFEVKDIGEGE